MSPYTLLALGAAGAGAVALVKGKTALGVGGIALAGAAWWYGQRQQAAVGAAASGAVQGAIVSSPTSPSGVAIDPTRQNVPMQVIPGTSAPQTPLAQLQYQAWLNHIATLPPGSPLPPPPPPNATPSDPPPPPPVYVTETRPDGTTLTYVPQTRTGRGHF